jgi:KDO2-lipid IV(A) lauroyltransferase
LGELLCRVAAAPRRVALRNLEIAFPEKHGDERAEILRRSCRNLGRTAAEFCHLHELSAETVRRYVEIADPAAWRRTLEAARRRGAVVLTGHVGNWELLAYAHGLLGHPVTLVHRPMRNAAIDDLIIAVRSRAGTRSIGKHAAAKEALRALRRRDTLAIPADQNQSRRSGVFVSFFGLPASTTAGPARLAMITGAPIFPVFLLREGETDVHRLEVLPEVELVRTGDRDADVVANTQRCTGVIEDVIRRRPDQWIWFHKRWRTRPVGEGAVY